MAQTSQFGPMQGHWQDLLSDPREDGPEIALAYYTWSMLNHNLPQAQSTLELWQKDYPPDPEPSALLGLFFESQYDWMQAEVAYRRAIAIDPTNDNYRLSLANVLQQNQKIEEATPIYEDYLSRHPNHIKAIRGLAECFASRGNPEKSLSLLREAIAMDPEDFETQKAYGERLLANGESQAAVEVLEKAHQAVPEYADLAYTYACALKYCGREAEAAPLFALKAESGPSRDRMFALEKQLRYQPNNLEIRMEIAAITAKYLSRRDAIRWYKNVLELAPNFGPAHQALADLYAQMGESELAKFHSQQVSAH
jgi:tetratricopeptide (TPR) repeat protein